MKVGILSDTHGNIPATTSVVEVFKKAGVKAVFHCGDIGSCDVLSELAGLEVPVHAVLGNVDIHSSEWRFFPTNVGVHLYGIFGEIDFHGRRIALLHSDDQHRFGQVVDSDDYDFVFSGHSHEVHDYMDGRTRCINPGATGRDSPNTCAVLDLKSGALEICTV